MAELTGDQERMQEDTLLAPQPDAFMPERAPVRPKVARRRLTKVLVYGGVLALLALLGWGLVRANEGQPDLGTRISQAYRMDGVPETYYVAKNGELRGLHIGPMQPPQLDEKIDELLAER